MGLAYGSQRDFSKAARLDREYLERRLETAKEDNYEGKSDYSPGEDANKKQSGEEKESETLKKEKAGEGHSRESLRSRARKH